MKILIVSHEYPPIGGGGSNACMYLSREYARQGHEVVIVTVWYAGLAEYECIEDNAGKIHIYRLKAKRKYKESSKFSEMLDFVVKAIGKCDSLVGKAIVDGCKFDICQVFFGIPSGAVGLYLKKRYKLPYVIRFGGGDIPGFQDRFDKVYKLIAPAIKNIWKNANALVVNSKGLKKLAYDFCDKYPMEIFPNGVDAKKFYPRNNHEETTIKLLFVSRLIERKGLQYLIPRLGELQASTKRQLRLVIVGDGPYRHTLEQLVDDYGVRSMVTFEGQKDKEELLEYYQMGDAFVFPSQKEGMPNAVLEAMACGLPIIMSPCQGSDELIDGNGIISDPDLHLFADSAMEFLKLDAEKQQHMAYCSRKRAEDIFSWESVAEKYLELYDQIT